MTAFALMFPVSREASSPSHLTEDQLLETGGAGIIPAARPGQIERQVEHDAAPAQDDDAVGQGDRLADMMSDEHGREGVTP
jgi:hypothetical protein